MEFIATWFAGETAISSDKAGNFLASREIARSRMVAHKIRSGATHCQVRTGDGVLMFDSREGHGPAAQPAPLLAAKLARRWTMPNLVTRLS